MRNVAILAICVALAGCGKTTPVGGSPPEERPLLAEVVEQYRAAGVAQIDNLNAVLGSSTTIPMTTVGELADVPLTLPVTDIVVNRGVGLERPGNTRIITIREMANAPEIIRDVPGYYDFMSSQTWATLNFDPRTANGFFRTVYQTLTEENPEGDASAALVASLQEFAELKYLIVVREVGYRAPAVLANRRFEAGHVAADMLVFDLQNRRLLGLLPVTATNSGETDDLATDLKLNLRVAIEGHLALAQGNTENHVPPMAALSPIEQFRRACSTGDGIGCFRVAAAYFDGTEGFQQDLAEAVRHYDLGCQHGHAESCTVIATAYRDGESVTEDRARARQLFGQACDGGSIEGCGELGIMLVTENGGPPNFPAARVALTSACDRGHHVGCMFLGMIEQFGSDGPVNVEAARVLFQRACDGGVADACNRVAELPTP